MANLWRVCCWRGCGMSGRALRSGSSSTPCWFNSVNLASLAASSSERWLPVLWALDYFKHAQAQNMSEGGWTMKPVDEAAVPPAHNARQAFIQAMDAWDETAADAAMAGLARTAGANEIFELLYRYGARDFRSIGHKAIFVANGQSMSIRKARLLPAGLEGIQRRFDRWSGTHRQPR